MNNYLSNIELYYSPQINNGKEIIISEAEDFKHIVKVMRHSVDDHIYITNGLGKIFKCNISNIDNNTLSVSVNDTFDYENKFSNITFCIPKLKSPDRFEFALEKCVELGITNFIVFDSERTVAKGNKIERWNKILISAMKQSLRSYLPHLSIHNSIEEIKNQTGNKIVFEQTSNSNFKHFKISSMEKYYFVFGPEGGLSENELNLFNENHKFYLASNRLRTETAIVKCASMINELI